jgi:hypothetical protein
MPIVRSRSARREGVIGPPGNSHGVRDDAAAKGQIAREQIFDGLLI